MPALAASILGLYLGPLATRLGRFGQGWLHLLDGFVLVAIAGLVLTHLLPEGIATLGAGTALLAAGAGFVVPAFLEARVERTRGLALLLAMGGLLVHAAIDGAALAGIEHLPGADLDHGGHAPEPAHGDEHGHGHGHGHGAEGHHGHHLQLGIILHRLPVGLVVFLAVARVRGSRWGLGAVTAMAAATAVGFGLGEMAHFSGVGFAVLQVLVVGALLHVVLHGIELPSTVGVTAAESHTLDEDDDPPGLTERLGPFDDPISPPPHRHSRPEHLAAVGALLAFGALALLGDAHGAHGVSAHAMAMWPAFATLALGGAPWLLLAYVALAGLRLARLRGWLPPIGAAFLATPLERRMMLERPGSARQDIRWLVGGPLLALDALFISVPLLGPTLAGLRLLAGLVLLGILMALSPPDPDRPSSRPWKVSSPIEAVLAWAEHTLPMVAVGILLAAVAEPLFETLNMGSVPIIAQAALVVLVAAAVDLGAAGATALAAIALHKGLPAGVVLAFLVAATSLSPRAFLRLRLNHGVRRASVTGAIVVVFAVALAMGVEALGPSLGTAGDPTPLAGHQPPADDKLTLVALGLLGVTLLIALFRHGPRCLVERILRPGAGTASEPHGHAH